ncbi:MAG: Cupin 2, conserved barrel [Thermoleophilia bacterium]|nr:Cupin 2, conserved barrel [Thermoleophilia bacterium]
MPDEPSAQCVRIDAAELARSGSGARWGHAGVQLNATLLAWPAGHVVTEHVNDEREVLLVGIAGSGVVRVEDVEHDLHAGIVLVVPRGARRTMRAGVEGMSYVAAHQARGRLQLTPRSSPPR